MCDSILNEQTISDTEWRTGSVYPRVYKSTDCSGESWPTTLADASMPNAASFSSTLGAAPRSVIVPENYSYTFGGITYPGPLVLTDVTATINDTFQFTTSTGLEGWQRNVCLGEPLTIWSLDVPTSFQPGQPSCDDLFTNYCLSTGYDTPECSCFRAQDELDAQFPGVVVPAACFSEECRDNGYKTIRMLSQECRLGYCQDFIVSNLSPFVSDMDVTISCGDRTFTVPEVTETEDPADTLLENEQITVVVENETTPLWQIVVIIISILLFSILLAFMTATIPQFW